MHVGFIENLEVSRDMISTFLMRTCFHSVRLLEGGSPTASLTMMMMMTTNEDETISETRNIDILFGFHLVPENPPLSSLI